LQCNSTTTIFDRMVRGFGSPVGPLRSIVAVPWNVKPWLPSACLSVPIPKRVGEGDVVVAVVS